MTGGGFGGCVLALVRADAADRFADTVAPRYTEATGRAPWIHVCRLASGSWISKSAPTAVTIP